jgi:hypothetical protein
LGDHNPRFVKIRERRDDGCRPTCRGLGGDQGLLLLQRAGYGWDRRGGSRRSRRSSRSLEALLGSSWEVLALVLGGGILLGGVWRDGTAASVADQLLCLGRVVADVLLGDIGGASSVLAGNLPNLLGLLVDDVRGIGNVVVNQLLVGLVDEGA